MNGINRYIPRKGEQKMIDFVKALVFVINTNKIRLKRKYNRTSSLLLTTTKTPTNVFEDSIQNLFLPLYVVICILGDNYHNFSFGLFITNHLTSDLRLDQDTKK